MSSHPTIRPDTSASSQQFDTSTRKLRILIVSPVRLDALCHGTGLRVHHLVRCLRNRHDITVLCTSDVPISASARGDGVPRLRSLLTLGSPYTYQREVHEAITARVHEGGFDVAVFFGAELLHYIEDCPIPVIADVVDNPTCVAGLASKGFLEFLRLTKRLISLIPYERRWCRIAKANLVVAEKDARSLSRIIGRDAVKVLPNGVDTEYFAPQGLPVKEGEIVFSGNMGFPPNIQACTFFAERIFPRVLEVFPTAHWTIVGGYPDPCIEELAVNPAITVTGFVPDIRPYIEQAAVVVSPLISGGGLKNKILEAWAMRKAIVATPYGAAGIDARDGVNLLIAKNPRSFAEKTIRLLRNKNERNALGLSGYETVVQQYSWDDQARKLEQLMRKAVG